jgi:hypothetical protein
MRFKAPVYVLILLALIGIAYSNSFLTPLHYDDSVNLIRNKNIHMETVTWENLKKTWFAGGERGDIYHPVLYRPVVMMSLAWNYYFHELDVFGYHAVNFLIHITASIFLYSFILQILTIRRINNANLIAFFATALWALNPVHLTAVTYVVQRMTSLAGMLYIISMFFYLQGRVSGRTRYWIASLVAAVLAVGSKENAIMLFVAIPIFDVLFFEQPNLKRNILILSGFAAVAVLLVLAVQGWETFSYNKLQAGFEKREFTMLERLMTQPRVILFYLMVLFFPSHNLLSLTHTVPISTGLMSPPETLIAMVIIVTIITLATIHARRHPLISFAVFFFFLNHLIEGSVFPLEMVYEHRNYVPSMFLFLPAAICIVYAYRRLGKLAIMAASAMLIFCVYNTHAQNEVWKSDLALWRDTVKKSPDPRSMFNLGGAYYTKYREEGKREDLDFALNYWSVATKFNEAFGTNYNEDIDTIPYGRVMHMAHHNARMLKMAKDGKIRRAWAIKGDVSDKMIPIGRQNENKRSTR